MVEHCCRVMSFEIQETNAVPCSASWRDARSPSTDRGVSDGTSPSLTQAGPERAAGDWKRLFACRRSAASFLAVETKNLVDGKCFDPPAIPFHRLRRKQRIEDRFLRRLDDRLEER